MDSEWLDIRDTVPQPTMSDYRPRQGYHTQSLLSGEKCWRER